MAHIALQKAQLCLDCETIGDDSTGCVLCLSKAVHPLASFLDREPVGAIPHTCADNPNLLCPACQL